MNCGCSSRVCPIAPKPFYFYHKLNLNGEKGLNSLSFLKNDRKKEVLENGKKRNK